jgi:hypothetical protein
MKRYHIGNISVYVTRGRNVHRLKTVNMCSTNDKCISLYAFVTIEYATYGNCALLHETVQVMHLSNCTLPFREISGAFPEFHNFQNCRISGIPETIEMSN